ncbi:hypothetical protein COOONC_22792 [Cooperia oncophora]
MARRRRMVRNDGSTETNGETSSGPASWDALTYKRPKKLKVPCARVESDGEWFQIERVLETVCLVGSDKGWQNLVQWKPNWSKQIHTPSALKDFYGRATVLGCVVKNETLRSRVRRKIEWNRKEFMSCNFRIRVEHPDGSVTSEINIPRCLYLHKCVAKKEEKAQTPTSDVQNPPADHVESLTVVKQEVSPSSSPKKDFIQDVCSESVPLKEGFDVRKKAGLKRRSSRRFGARTKWSRSRSLNARASANELISSPSTKVQQPFNEVSNREEARAAHTKVTMPPGISPACAQEFLRKVRSAGRRRSTPSHTNIKLRNSSSKHLNGKRPSTSNTDEEIVVIGESTPKNEPNRSRLSLPNNRSVRSISTPRSSLKRRPNGKRSPGAKENHERDMNKSLKKPSDSGTKSQHKTMSAKRPRRSSEDGKSLSSKRFTPMRPRNSLDYYFNCASRKIEVLGNVTNQQNISTR